MKDLENPIKNLLNFLIKLRSKLNNQKIVNLSRKLTWAYNKTSKPEIIKINFTIQLYFYYNLLLKYSNFKEKSRSPLIKFYI